MMWRKAKLERPTFAVQPEWRARRLTAPHRFVDQKIVAIEPLDAFNLALRQVDEHSFVERTRRLRNRDHVDRDRAFPMRSGLNDAGVLDGLAFP